MYCFHEPISNWKTIKRNPYTLIIADTPCRMKQGLQALAALPKNTFMLFPRIKSGTYFHTLNCLFDMDIVALDALGKVLAVFSAKPGQKKIGPMPYGTDKVIEGPFNWFKSNGIVIGDFLPLFSL